MPELPEVQATVNYLHERIVGLTVQAVKVFWPRTVAGESSNAFSERLLDADISAVFRRGKFIGIRLRSDEPLVLFTHLRMSGSLDILSAKTEPHKHDRVIIEFSNGKSLRFSDPRKFGRMYLYTNETPIHDALGIEPLSEEFTTDTLFTILTSHRAHLKPLLLNQRLVAGLGNIYVDEALWRAGIHPRTPSERVSFKKTSALRESIQETLSEAISLLGTDFGDGVVDGGMYRPRVYGRTGAPCERCGTTIKKTIVGQRGTHFCPFCQRPPRTRPG